MGEQRWSAKEEIACLVRCSTKWALVAGGFTHVGFIASRIHSIKMKVRKFRNVTQVSAFIQRLKIRAST